MGFFFFTNAKNLTVKCYTTFVMCGRYIFADIDTSPTFAHFDLKNKPKLVPSYNIAPDSHQLTVVHNSPNKGMYMRWGFRPQWFKKAGGVINARSETIEQKPMFKKAFERARCLVPTTGFYEWTTRNDEKIPYFIHLKNNHLFAFAGIYDYYKKGNDDHYSYAIITTQANGIMKPIHTRMPVIIDKQDYDVWLNAKSSIDILKKLCIPYDNEKNMEAYPVSTMVNDPHNDDKRLIEKHNF